MKHRIEKDSMGEVRVPADRLWGAQTERSLQNFRIGTEKMPLAFLYSYAQLKKACASVNHDLGKLNTSKKDCIVTACEKTFPVYELRME